MKRRRNSRSWEERGTQEKERIESSNEIQKRRKCTGVFRNTTYSS
jgi:hypothetical protein